MEEIELEKFLERYYETPDATWAVEGLQDYLSETECMTGGENILMPYRFGRLAQLHPAVAKTFRQAIAAASDTKPEFCAALNEWLGEGHPAPKNALDTIIHSPQDNDLHWTEFSLTGQPEPIIRLIDLFERADKVRTKFDDWLSRPESIFAKLFGTRRRICEKIESTLDIVFETEAGVLKSADDLDMLFFMRGDAMIISQQLEELATFVPIKLSAREVNYCVTKATAKWSLSWSATKNARVRKIIVDQIEERSGSTLTTLLEIAARAHLALEDPETAKHYLDRYLERNPTRKQIIGLVGPLAAIETIEALAPIANSATTVEPAVPKSAVGDRIGCALRNEEFCHSGFGKVTIGLRKGKNFDTAEDQSYMEWSYKFDNAGSIDVLQWMDPSDWDQWVSIGGKVFQSAGIWFEIKDKGIKRGLTRTNSLLRNPGWRDALKKNRPTKSKFVQFNRKQYLKVTYDSRLLHKVIMKLLPVRGLKRGGKAKVEIWIDCESDWMVAAHANIRNVIFEGEPMHFYLRHSFSLQNFHVEIKQPELMVAPPGLNLEPGTEMEFYTVPSDSKLFSPD